MEQPSLGALIGLLCEPYSILSYLILKNYHKTLVSRVGRSNTRSSSAFFTGSVLLNESSFVALVVQTARKHSKYSYVVIIPNE